MTEGKVCTKCGLCKPLEAFHRKAGQPSGLNPRCKACNCADVRAWNAANKVANVERKRRWRQEDPERAIKESRRCYEQRKADRPDVIRAQGRAAGKRAAERLTDSYVRTALRAGSADVSPELIALKREQLSLHRLLRDLKQAIEKEPT